MKFNKPLLIFVVLAITSISIPIFMGKIPSMPRKSGDGWTPVIDLHANPERFWRYTASAAMFWPILFSMYLLTTARKDDRRRTLLALILFFGSGALAFYLS
jgi:dolichol kinase